MSTEIRINADDSFKKVSYLLKTNLKEKSDVTVVGGVYSSLNISRVAENLQRLGYVTLTGVTTTTKVQDGKRRIHLTVGMKKTKDFDKLNNEQEERRKAYLEEKEKKFGENKEFTKKN